MAILDGLIGCWSPSLGASGYRLLDRTLGGNHGTLTNMDAGTDWTASSIGTVLDFDGSNDWVSIPRPRAFTATPARWTWCLWAKLNAGYGKCFDCNFTTGMIVYLSAGSLSGGIQVGIGGTYPRYSSTQLTAGRWAFCVISFSDLTARFFLNGKPDGSGTVSANPNFGSSVISFGGTGGSETINGQLGEMAIWNRDLAASEIADVYRRGHGWIGRELTSVNRRRRAVKGPSFRAAWALRQRQILGGGGGLG